MAKKGERTVPAANFMGTLAANVGNLDLTDAQFREFFRRTQSIVQYDDCERIEKELQEKLSLDNLNRIFKGKEVVLKSVRESNAMSLIMGICIEFADSADGSVILVVTDSKRRFALMPDSISLSCDKIEGFVSKGSLDRYRIELV